MDQTSVEGSLYIYIVQHAQALHRLWALHSCSALRNKKGHGLAQMHPLPLCVQIRLQLLSSMLGRLHTMKGNIFICVASHQILSWFIINICNLQPSSNLPTLVHTRTRMHACKRIHMVLAHVCPHNALHSSTTLCTYIAKYPNEYTSLSAGEAKAEEEKKG